MPPTPTLGLVKPQEWQARTSLLVGRRSPTLLKVDAAYSQYYNVRSEETKSALYNALHQYLIEHKSNWALSDRNKRSGGLMQYIYDSCKPYTAKNVLESRAPEARHGVLYLWQNAEIGTKWTKIALQGALDIGSNTGNMLQATTYTGGGKLQPLGVISEGSSWSSAVTSASVVDKVHGAFNSAKGSATFQVSSIRPDPGILERAKELFGVKFSEIWTWIKRRVEKMWNDIQLQWHSGGMWAPIGAVVAGLVNFILGQVCAVAAPFAGSGITIAQGFAKGFSAAADRVTAMYHRRHFLIAPGHPQLIGDAIETQMNWDIGRGIYTMAKGGVALAADIATAGASALISAIAACVEFAWKVINRYLEGLKMNAWIKEVKSVTRDRSTWKADPKDGKWRPAIAYKEREFLMLFEKGCNASVCIPMMTLNSGITGDLMMFMKMFDDTGSILGQSTGASLQGPTAEAQKKFNAGQEYWTALKHKSRNYLESTGFDFMSSDKVVAGLMDHAIKHHTGIASKADRALAFAAGS